MADWRSLIVDVPDFPKPGVTFKDITPLLADAAGFKAAIDAFAEALGGRGVTQLVGVESRGFILGAPLALAMGVGLTLVRKPGKLPRAVEAVSYELEYGTDRVEMHRDALGADDRVVIIDDVLATGGTAAAVCELVGRTDAELLGLAVLMELDFLSGRQKLPAGLEVISLINVG